MEAVDVLRDDRVELSCPLERHERAMPVVRLCLPRRTVQPRLPRQPPHLGIGQVVVDVRHPLRFRISGPDAIWTSEIGDAGFRGDACARQRDDAGGRRDETAGGRKVQRLKLKVQSVAFGVSPLHPFYREAGSGPGVVCLHSNASSSTQWRGLMETLAGEFHVLAADSFGAGQSPGWPANRRLSLGDEVALLEPAFAHAGNPHALVGHSYGAAVAFIAAVAQPHRVRALALYEPVLFSLLDAESPPPNEADGIRAALAGAAAALDEGNPSGASECFIDFWMGRGTWARMPDSRKGPIAASITNIRQWAAALLDEPTPLTAFSNLEEFRLVHDGPRVAGVVARRRAAPDERIYPNWRSLSSRVWGTWGQSHTRRSSITPSPAFSNAADSARSWNDQRGDTWPVNRRF